MKNDNKRKLFHDVKNAVVSIKMGIDMLKIKSEADTKDDKLIGQIDQAIKKLNSKWKELKNTINK